MTSSVALHHEDDMRTFFRKYWQLITAARSRVFTAFIWIGAVQLLALVEPWMFKHVVDLIVSFAAAAKEQTTQVLWTMLAVLVGMGGVTSGKNYRLISLMGLLEYGLPLICGRKLLNLPLSYHHTENTGLSVGKVIRGVGNMTALTGLLFFEIAPLGVQILITAALFLNKCAAAIMVMLPVVAVFCYLTWKVKTKLQATRSERHALDGDADEILSQAITNVMTVQAFCQEEREMKVVEGLRAKVRRLLEKEYAVHGWADVVRNSIISIGRVGVIAVCAWAVFSHDLTPGELVFVVTLSERIFVSCYRVGSIFDRVAEAMEPVLRMQAILAEPETTPDPDDPVEPPARFQGRIEYRDIVYSYPRRGAAAPPRPPVLQNLRLVIEPGQKVGLVGPSGGGKTTIAKLVERFYDPDSGEVAIDGIPLKRMRKAAFRRQIGYVPQEVEIKNDTVAENIAYGCPGIDREAVVRAAKAANAHEFIMEDLEHGYDTVVGNGGQFLSGGQRQRVGIARALLIDPPILVFDEATSNVDSMSEQKIHEAMAEICKGRTVIIIAHKLATVRDADRIFVVDHGCIADAGTHDELIDRPGIYRQIASLQRLHQG
ncbi:ABC transporter ATP-binding protein [Candidatus Uhrbacteria bacterium]|nr:ABC transporter ATP-binding protein [Candidatus Uhrbacteria bacterium]